MKKSLRSFATGVALLLLTVASAWAEETYELDIADQELSSALKLFAEQSGLQVVYFADLANGKQAKGVHGSYSADQALAELLDDTQLTYSNVDDRTYSIAAPAAAEDKGGDSDSGKSRPTPRPVMMAQASQREENTAEGEEEESNQSSSSKDAEDLKLEEIIVVGSRLGTSPVESALPVKLITREQIERSGAGSIAQVLSLLPEVSLSNIGDRNSPEGVAGSTNSATVQLRGMPVGTTLVLVNGRRVGNSSAFSNPAGAPSFFDLSNIPVSMVERIEVLPYGASAVYGGDGLAGVVNIVTKRNVQGLDVRIRNSLANGYDETHASVTWGQSWSRGSVTATASYLKTGSLSSSERALTSDQDFRRFGGRDWRNRYFANPGTIYSLDGCPPPPSFCALPLDQRGNLPGLESPVAGIPAGQDGQDLTPADFAATAGVENLSTLDSRFFSASETTSIAIQGRYEISPRLELFGDLLYSKRDVPSQEAALQMFLGERGFARVSAENPFNPFGVDVGVNVLTQTTGVFWQYQPEYFQPQLGMRGEIANWTWELAGSLSKDLADITRSQGDASAVGAALGSSDPATALNPFRGDDGPFAAQELLDSFFIRPTRDFSGDLWQANGFVRGPLAKLPAGPIHGLIGFEWGREELQFQGVDDPDPENPSNVSGNDESHAAFAEIRLPLVTRSGGQEGYAGELLALTGAFRVDESDRLDETGTSETVGLEIRPAASLLVRASYSSAFKPLSTFSAFQDTSIFSSPFVTITDPTMNGETFIVDLVEGGGLPPGLKPETSTSHTAGIVWTPESFADLNLSLTAWKNRLRDRISALDQQTVVDNEDAFPGRVIRDPSTGIIVQVDRRPGNISLINVEGVDVGLSWRWETRYGDFSPSVAATWVAKHEEQLAPTSPLVDRLGVRPTSSSWSPRWKGTTALGWDYEDKVHATLIGRYVSAYEDSLALDTGMFQTLGDIWQFNLNVDLSVGRWLAPEDSRLSGTRLSLGAINLFNRLPEFCNACGSSGYDATQYDIRGRFAYAELRFSL